MGNDISVSIINSISSNVLKVIQYASVGSISLFVVNELLKKFYYKRNNLPGPAPTMFLGNIVEMMGRKKKSGNLLIFHDWSVKYGDLFEFFIFNQRSIVVTTPELFKQVISDIKTFPHTSIANGASNRRKGSMTAMTGANHARHRRAINPIFKPENMIPYGPMIAEESAKLVKKWQEQQQQRHGQQNDSESDAITVDVVNDIQSLVLSIFGKTSFGSDWGGDDGKNHKLIEATTISLRRALAGNKVLWFTTLFPTEENRKVVEARKYFDDTVRSMIKSRREKYQNMTEEESQNYQKMDLLDHLLACRDEEAPGKVALEEFEVEDELVAFISAAHETTSFNICFALYYLAKNPVIQDKLREEINHAVGDKEVIDQNDLSNMPYLDAIIKESLRLDAPAQLFGRVSEFDTELNGYKIPKGTMVLCYSAFVHRHPNYFPDPNEFIPERWLNNDTETKNPFIFMPFGGGQRVCVGKRLANFENRAVVAALIRKLKFELVEEITRIADPLHKPERLLLKITTPSSSILI